MGFWKSFLGDTGELSDLDTWRHRAGGVGEWCSGRGTACAKAERRGGWGASLTPAWQGLECQAQGLGWLLRQWQPRRVMMEEGHGRERGAARAVAAAQVQADWLVGEEGGGSHGGTQPEGWTGAAVPRPPRVLGAAGSHLRKAVSSMRAGPQGFVPSLPSGLCAASSRDSSLCPPGCPVGLQPARSRGEAGGKPHAFSHGSSGGGKCATGPSHGHLGTGGGEAGSSGRLARPPSLGAEAQCLGQIPSFLLKTERKVGGV